MSLKQWTLPVVRVALWSHCGVTVDAACLKTLNVHNPSNTDQCSEPKVALSALGRNGHENRRLEHR